MEFYGIRMKINKLKWESFPNPQVGKIKNKIACKVIPQFGVWDIIWNGIQIYVNNINTHRDFTKKNV